MPSEESRNTSLAVVIDDGEVIDLKTITISDAMRVYPFVLGMQHTLRRMIERDMETSGAQERLVGGIQYQFKPTEEWEVQDAVGLRSKLLAQVPEGGITTEEVEESIKIVVAGKADNHKLNALAKRSATVRQLIEIHRKRTTALPRLKYKTMGR